MKNIIRKIFAPTMTIMVILSSLVLFPIEALAKKPIKDTTVYCDAGENLQVAIDNAKVGSELFVNGSCDDGPYFVNKDIILSGPATLSAPNGGHDVIFIQSADVTLRSLTIDATYINVTGIQVESGRVLMFGGSVTGATEDGIQVIGTGWGSLQDCKFSGNLNGVHADINSSIFVRRCNINNNTGFGVIALNSSSIFLDDNNIIEFNRDGVWSGVHSTIQIENSNTISNNTKFGVAASRSGFIWFTGLPTTIENNGDADLMCEYRSIFDAETKQLSTSAISMISEDCLMVVDVF